MDFLCTRSRRNLFGSSYVGLLLPTRFFVERLSEHHKDFVLATTGGVSHSLPKQQPPSMQTESLQPLCDAALPTPATEVKVGVLSLPPVSMSMSTQQQTSAAFSLTQPVAASSATFTSAMAAPASTTVASRRRWHPWHHRGLQQHEVGDYILDLRVFSKEETKINTDLPVHGPGYEEPVLVHERTKTDKLLPKSSTEHLIPLHSYLASLCIDHATTHASKKSGFKTVFTGDASREAQLSPCGNETQVRLDPEAELEVPVCSGPPEKPVAASMGVTGQFVQPLLVSAGGSGEPPQHSMAPAPPSVPAECSGEPTLPSVVAMPPPAMPQPEVSAPAGPATPAGGSAEPIQHPGPVKTACPRGPTKPPEGPRTHPRRRRPSAKWGQPCLLRHCHLPCGQPPDRLRWTRGRPPEPLNCYAVDLRVGPLNFSTTDCCIPDPPAWPTERLRNEPLFYRDWGRSPELCSGTLMHLCLD
ncbi:unnamed protein product [Oreochromis niloticus]|nr:unnamed protein product [Mustela putorius furo]